MCRKIRESCLRPLIVLAWLSELSYDWLFFFFFFLRKVKANVTSDERGKRLAFLPLQMNGSGAFFSYGGIIRFCLFVCLPLTHFLFTWHVPPLWVCMLFCTGIVAFNSRALIQSISRDVSIKCVLNNAARGSGKVPVVNTPRVSVCRVVVLFYVLLRLHP